jgi:hypothetical protein
MKPIDYFYFNIYNHFYRRSHQLQDFSARIQAMYLFSLCAGGWLLFLEAVYLRVYRHSWFSSRPISTLFAGAVYLLTASVFHHIFIVKERDRAILGKYEEAWERNANKKRDLLISAFLIVVPYVLLISLTKFFPRHG